MILRYVDDTSLKLHEELEDVCAKNDLSLKEATLRWIMHHSILGDKDGLILGASSKEQMEENLKACENGPLPQEIAQAFDDLDAKFGGIRPPHPESKA